MTPLGAPYRTGIAAVVVACTAIMGCELKDRPETRDVALLPSGASASLARAVPGSPDTGVSCVTQDGRQLSARGVVRREVHAGPPGYGDTPALDKRDTILVLLLASRVRVCTDRAVDPRGPAVVETDSVQLVGRVDPRAHQPGDTVMVFGTFRQQTWGWHYTPIVLHADSVARDEPTRDPIKVGLFETCPHDCLTYVAGAESSY